MSAGIRRLMGGGVMAAAVALMSASTPAPTLASCIPPQFQTFSGEPDTVVLAGTVTQVAATQVAVEVQLWWGENPRSSVVIERPPKDPNVITSVDWEPKPGEPWVIIARRDAGVLRTSTCEQLPGTQATVREVESSLGPGVEPAASAIASPSPEPNATAGDSPTVLVIAAVASGIAAFVVAWFLWRRRQTA